jgi:hypothetical protein
MLAFAAALTLTFVAPGIAVRPSQAQEIIAPHAPPPPRHERIPPPPPGRPAEIVVWDPGHWHWDGRAWVWRPGHYIERPRREAKWVPGHWATRGPQYVWVEGHWR